jgi:hypothetical protein
MTNIMPRKDRNYLKMKKTTPNAKIQVAGRISLELYSLIEKAAKKREKSISSQVSHFIELGIQEYKKSEEVPKIKLIQNDN